MTDNNGHTSVSICCNFPFSFVRGVKSIEHAIPKLDTVRYVAPCLIFTSFYILFM